MARNLLLFAWIWALASAWAPAAQKAKWHELPVVRCPVASDAPRIDGKLDDAVWKSAVKLGPFVTTSDEKPKVGTEALLARDGKFLYIAVRCAEPDMKSVCRERRKRDSDVWMDDCVEVFVDGNWDLKTYRHFVVSVANVQRDEACDITKKEIYDVKWNGKWKSAVQTGAAEWTAELAIPFADIGVKAGAETMIGLNVCRERKKENELTVWSPTFGGFHKPNLFGMVILCREQRSPVSLTSPQISPPAVGILNAGGTVSNTGKTSLDVICSTFIATPKAVSGKAVARFRLKPGESMNGSIPFAIAEAGRNNVVFVLRDKPTGRFLLVRNLTTEIAAFEMEEFGEALPSPGEYVLWWAGSTNKVLKEMPVPKETSDAVTINAAANEYEPFQIVLNSTKPLESVKVEVGDLKSDVGTISSRNILLYREAYVPVTIRSDRFGMLTDYPDPLPVLRGSFDCPAGENVPLWLVVKTPKDAKPGDYEGTVTLRPGNAPAATVKVKLHVYDFALTDETHTKTAYGVSPNWRFLGITDPEDKERVFDYFMQSCRDHRISPYHPMALHPMKYEIRGPRRSFKNGPFEIVSDEYSADYFAIFWNGKKIGSLHNTMTQFTKEGIGWKGTGVSWPGVARMKAIHVVERSPARWVMDVTGEKVTSGPAAKKYEITFRFVIPAGQNWFSARMLRLTNTDEEKFEARGYFYILRCEEEGAKKQKSKTHIFYRMKHGYLGVIEPTGSVSLNLAPLHVTKGARWLKPGESIEVEQPPVIFFAGEGDASAADAAAREIIESLGGKSPEEFEPPAGATLTVEENAEPSLTFDFADFDKAASKYLDGYKFNGFRFPAVPGRLGPFVRFEDGFKKLHKRVFGRMVDHLREKGWLDKAYAYWFDEPSEDEYPYVNEGMDLLKENCPGLARLLTEQVEDELIGHVNLWVPVLSRYDPIKCQLRQAHGERVWWYVCCGPRAPYPNNFIDHPAINHRIRFWMMEKYGVTGSLYWSTTYWYGKDRKFRSPWEDAMSINPRGGHWGCGDGMMFYPPCREPSDKPVVEPPVISIRLELLREGLEDREYFWTLRRELKRVRDLLDALPPERKVAALAVIRQAERALGAPDRLAESLTEYTKDPRDIFRERDRIARAIEACRNIRK